jgi:hypothetical protein
MEPRGFVDAYLRAGRGGPARDVVLRPVGEASVHDASHPLRGGASGSTSGDDVGSWRRLARGAGTSSPSTAPTSWPFWAAATERALRRFLG